MKQKIKRLICRILGHSQTIEEVYAKRYKTHNGKAQYAIIQQTICPRCGKTISRKVLDCGLTRTKMLQKEWFITEQ